MGQGGVLGSSLTVSKLISWWSWTLALILILFLCVFSFPLLVLLWQSVFYSNINRAQNGQKLFLEMLFYVRLLSY